MILHPWAVLPALKWYADNLAADTIGERYYMGQATSYVYWLMENWWTLSMACHSQVLDFIINYDTGPQISMLFKELQRFINDQPIIKVIEADSPNAKSIPNVSSCSALSIVPKITNLGELPRAPSKAFTRSSRCTLVKKQAD